MSRNPVLARGRLGIHFAFMRGMAPTMTTEWVLRRDRADVICTRRETDRGIEVSVTFCGLPVAKCVTATLANALEWALNRRDSWLAAGYDIGSAVM